VVREGGAFGECREEGKKGGQLAGCDPRLAYELSIRCVCDL